MKKLFNIIVFLISVAFTSNAQKELYTVTEIPGALKSNAHTVFRLLQYDIEIKSASDVSVRVEEVRTILNKNGENNVNFLESYSPISKITSVKGNVFDSNGKKIRTLGYDDVKDYSNMGYSLYDQNRVKFIDPRYLTFPMTVKYEYNMDLKQSLFLPDLYLYMPNTSYEKVIYKVTAPSDLKLQYKELNIPVKCQIVTNGNSKIYNWEISNIPAFTSEPYTSEIGTVRPRLMLVPEQFGLEGTKGDVKSWKNFGKWSADLASDKRELPEATKNKIKELCANKTSVLEKTKAVYEFMQQKTRYVSIQIGIGGWQPFGADVVDKYSYGDCKALSNYMVTLLDAAGIKSHYVLIKAGENASEIDTCFVSSQFNHAIVCVPNGADTIWLEATDQMMPCGFNGDFTDDRWALLVDNQNSKIVRTRIYSENENCICRNVIVKLTDDNFATGSVTTKYIGLTYSNMHYINTKNDEEKKRLITNKIQIPAFQLNSFELKEQLSATPVFTENLALDINNIAMKLNEKTFLLTLNLMNKYRNIPENVHNRKTPMSIRRDYMEKDTIEYYLTNKQSVNYTPSAYRITNQFGEYTAETKISGKKILYCRTFKLKKGQHSAADYSLFKEFLENVAQNDEIKLEITQL